MWHRLKPVFYWQGACSQLKAYLRERDTCQRNKSDLTTPAGLLQPLAHSNYYLGQHLYGFCGRSPKVAR
jgi:hypothetical protein